MVIVIEKLNMVVAASIGLVSEAITASRNKQGEGVAGERSQRDDTLPSPYLENDEEQWELDELQEQLREDGVQEGDEDEPRSKEKKIRNPARQADEFLKRHPLPESTPRESFTSRGLTRPVIIPQRRPGVRIRGFVRAYSPDLMNRGIDEKTFIDFLVTFNRASRAPEWMGAFNLTGGAAFAIPAHAAGFGVGLAIQIVTAIAMEVKGRIQSNDFLRKLNEGFFRPRGLYCLVMSFDNTHDSAMTEEGIMDNIASASTPKSGVKKYAEKVRTYDGLSGPVEFPEAAPLVFPELDWLIENGSTEQTQKLGKYKKFRKFVADYYDRRAQAEYAFKNPASPLATRPKRDFVSRYADPTDSTNLSPISLVTGGLVPVSKEWYLEGYRGGGRKIANKVLYMIIVNMPTEEDISRAEELSEQASIIDSSSLQLRNVGAAQEPGLG